MLSSIGTKIALKRVGLPSDALNFSNPFASDPDRPPPNKLRKDPPWLKPDYHGEADSDSDAGWASWVPLSMQPWLAPPPTTVTVGRVPQVGDSAPLDTDGKLRLGGRKTLVVFLRCVGCAFAQKTFLHLRTIANRFHSSIRCVAVSHSSERATKKWIDIMGGAWNVEVVVDEGRAVYAAWGLGSASAWHVLNPTTQVQSWKENGWLGGRVAEAMEKQKTTTGARAVDEDEDGGSVMGSKWQEAGAFAVDGKGTVIWGGKALRADDLMNLDEGAQLLHL